MSKQTKHVPKDAKVMMSILKDMGVTEYDPKVVNQMLEFAFRYTTDVLEDAKIYSAHAKKKMVDLEDVKLAIQMNVDKSFASPPPRDVLLELAKQRNAIPLPTIRPQCGVKLPHDRYCLTSANYKLKSNRPVIQSRFAIVNPHYGVAPRLVTSFNSNIVRAPRPSITPGERGTTPGPTMPSFNIVARPALSSGVRPPMPVIRLSSAPQPQAKPPAILTSSSTAAPPVSSTEQSTIVSTSVTTNLEEVGLSIGGAVKRKAEDDN